MKLHGWRKACAGVLVLLPGVYGACVLLYFNCFAETVPLGNVFPIFLILAIPSNITAVFFAILCILHLFKGSRDRTLLEKILWLLSFLVITGISLPVYWYRYMAEDTVKI